MEIFKTKKELRHYLDHTSSDKIVGYVPTMGALHEGHLSLIEQAKAGSGLVVCSIFVNPEQFNDPNDYKAYPTNLETDTETLRALGCDVLFIPSEDEVYENREPTGIDLEGLDEKMEGAYRPGHFRGVVMVLERLFNIVKPHKAYFGEKDHQQLVVVRQMVQQLNMGVEVIGCPTVRNTDGLAMSSRNERLSPDGKAQALWINRVLEQVRAQVEEKPLKELKQWAEQELRNTRSLDLEYFEIADANTLEPVRQLQGEGRTMAFVSAYVEGVRLIDNMVLDR